MTSTLTTLHIQLHRRKKPRNFWFSNFSNFGQNLFFNIINNNNFFPTISIFLCITITITIAIFFDSSTPRRSRRRRINSLSIILQQIQHFTRTFPFFTSMTRDKNSRITRLHCRIRIRIRIRIRVRTWLMGFFFAIGSGFGCSPLFFRLGKQVVSCYVVRRGIGGRILCCRDGPFWLVCYWRILLLRLWELLLCA